MCTFTLPNDNFFPMGFFGRCLTAQKINKNILDLLRRTMGHYGPYQQSNNNLVAKEQRSEQMSLKGLEI